jgi:hypothetical protein
LTLSVISKRYSLAWNKLYLNKTSCTNCSIPIDYIGIYHINLIDYECQGKKITSSQILNPYFNFLP